jgi:uncharacterized RmlC-like cupin family protein
MSTEATCKLIRPDAAYDGKTGLTYLKGIAKESVGSTGISMVLLNSPPGGRTKAHRHDHETAIYMISGETNTWYGERLENHVVLGAGDMFYIPAGVPHLAANLGKQPVVQVIARTDPNQLESVILMPELEALVPAEVQTET